MFHLDDDQIECRRRELQMVCDDVKDEIWREFESVSFDVSQGCDYIGGDREFYTSLCLEFDCGFDPNKIISTAAAALRRAVDILDAME